MTGSIELSEQKGNKGYFAKVFMEADFDETLKEHVIDFDERSTSNSNWKDAARFGLQYVLEHVPKKSIGPTPVRIRVTKIQGHPFDTNSIIIAYAAAFALLKALGKQELDFVTLDVENGKIAFSR